jgi:hypothetical protein
MTSFKGWITTTFLAASLSLSAVPASAGVIIGGGEFVPRACTETTTIKEVKADVGIIIGGLTGIIIGGFTVGIIIGGVADVPTQDCGIIIGG